MRHRKVLTSGLQNCAVNADAHKHRLYREKKRLEIHATHSERQGPRGSKMPVIRQQHPCTGKGLQMPPVWWVIRVPSLAEFCQSPAPSHTVGTSTETTTLTFCSHYQPLRHKGENSGITCIVNTEKKVIVQDVLEIEYYLKRRLKWEVAISLILNLIAENHHINVFNHP